MSTLSRAAVEAAADRDLSRYYDVTNASRTSPVDLELFAEAVMGLKIVDVNMAMLDFAGVDGSRILGGLYPEGQYFNHEDRVIIVDALIDRPGRKRFTVAHETGHFSLHVRKGKSMPWNRTERPFLCRDAGKFAKDPLEYQADCYASALLMPKALFPTLVTHNIEIDLERYGRLLQNAFQVSRQAAEIRLKTLGYGIINGKYCNRRLGTGEEAFAMMSMRENL
jgi:Zn-dependent peptidase ImmA (M78 family)